MLDLLAFLEAFISCVVADAALCAAVYNAHTNIVIKTADEFQTSNSRKTGHSTDDNRNKSNKQKYLSLQNKRGEKILKNNLT